MAWEPTTSAPAAPAVSRPLDFALVAGEGAAALRLESRELFGWLQVDDLELEVPTRGPLPPDSDPRSLQSRRTRVRTATLRMRQADLDAFVAARAGRLASSGIDQVGLRAMDGYVSLVARVRAGGHAAEITARCYLLGAGTRLRVLIDEARSYGFLPVPAPRAAHQAVVGLLAATAETTGPRWTAVRGLAEIAIEPLDALLWHTFPPGGWRLPDTSGVAIGEVRSQRGDVVLRYGARGRERRGRVRGDATGELIAAHERFRAAEELFRAGELAAALRAYRAELAARGPDQPFLIDRILSLTSAQPDYFVDAVELARQALGRWPDFTPAHNALANIAAAQNDGLEAAQRFQILAGAHAVVGDDDAASRAALAGARLLRRLSPAESTALYEQVLEHCPGEPEATEALAERFRDEGRWGDLIDLIRARIAGSSDPRAQARDHLRLAELLAGPLEDPRGAREELRTATRLDPHSGAALEALTEVELTLGERIAAVGALDRATDLYRERGELRAEARTLLRAAALAVEAGDDVEAERRFREALERIPNDATALRGAAAAASRLGRYAEAAELWRMLLVSATESAEAQAEFSFHLGECLLEDGDIEGARPALERAARAAAPAIAAEANARLAEIARGEGERAAAAAALEAAVEQLLVAAEKQRPGGAIPPGRLRSRAAELCLERARLLDTLSDEEGTEREYLRSFELGEERQGVRREAARALRRRAVAAGSDAEERRWIDALLESEPGDAERRRLLIDRARLALADGDAAAARADVELASGGASGDPHLMREALALQAEIARVEGEPTDRAEALEARAALLDDLGAAVAANLEAAEAWLDGDEPERAEEAARRVLDSLDDEDLAAESREAWRLRAHRARAEAAWRQRRFAELETSCRAVLEGGALLDARTHLELRFRLAVALDRTGDAEPAADHYRQVIDEADAGDPLRAQALRNLAELSERSGEFAEAARRFCELAREATEVLPDSARADAWYRAAELYRKHQGRVADAEACLEEALHLAADHMPALDALEALRREADDYERVAVILGRKIAATARYPDRQKALLARLARLQEEVLGRPDVAGETYHRALEIDPRYRPALRFVAAEARRAGQLERAAAALAELARELPDDFDLAENPDELAAERAAAAVGLAEVAAELPGDDGAADLAEEALANNLEADPEAGVAGALEALYRRRGKWSELAERLAAPGPGDRLARDLERIEVLWRQVGDAAAALVAVRAARDRHPDDDQLREYEAVLEDAASASDTETHPGIDAEIHKLFADAREARTRGDAAAALALLEEVAGPAAPEALLALRAELREEAGQWERAARDLTLLRRRAASAGETAKEHRICRSLAALTAGKLGDGLAAVALYERALEIDPDDLAAAEACVAIYERRGDRAAQAAALERVLSIARRTGAGPQIQTNARRDLASLAAAEGRLERALEHLDEALALSPEDEATLRALAKVHADRGDLEKQAETLRLLAGTLAARAGGRSYHAGNLYLELADLYYDHLHSEGRGRDAMLAAARSFGPGSRSRSILRLLASEAAAVGDSRTVVRALEMVPDNKLGSTDLIQLARAYQRLGLDHRAVEVLAKARKEARLSDEGAMMLFGLYRQLGRKRELAASLERGAAEAPPAIAATRLEEALVLYRDAIGDEAAAEWVRKQLTELAHVHQNGNAVESQRHRGPGPEELERAAEAAAAGEETAVAADLLARALSQRAEGLAQGGAGLDDATRRTLDSLRQLARRDHHYEALARGLLYASSVELERRAAADLLREAAQVRGRHLHDTRGAADALSRALALLPDDASLLEELDATLREAGDYSQLVSAYELHLGAIEGRRRAQPLVELARLYRDIFDEPARARSYLDQALEVAPELAGELDLELAELEIQSTRGDASREGEGEGEGEDEPEGPGRRSAGDLLELATELEDDGQIDAAIAQCERAAAMDAADPRPLEALERLYEKRGDWGAVSEVLGRMAGAAEEPEQRAAIWFRRAALYRDVLHREPEAYRCLKEAHANAPEDGAIAHELRTVAMARGEWALAAELVYREIAAATGDVDRGALYLELALIYDEKLLDVDAAIINYEQALAYDPEIPAAPRPLARLYELKGRHREAAEMYELAAARARSDADRGRLLRHAGMSAEHAKEPGLARRLYGLATVAGTSEDNEKAQVALARLGGDSAGAETRIRILEARLAETEDAEVALDVRRELLELCSAAGDADAALQHARALLASDRTDISAFVALKAEAAKTGDWQQLASLLSSRAAAVADSGEQASLYFELGRAYENDLGDLNAAVGAYEQALAADPEHPGALEALAEITYQKNDWLRAYHIYQRLDPARCSMPGDVIAFRQGEIAEALGRESQACDAFAEAVRLFPASRKALTALARTAKRVGDTGRAIAATRALLELAPASDIRSTTRARGELASLLAESGDIAGAIHYYELVVAEEPKAAAAVAELLSLYAEQGDYEGAARCLQSLIALTPETDRRADLLFRLGEIYRTQLGDPDLAADAYLKAADLAPEHAAVLRRLLEYYFRLGDAAGLLEVAADLSRAGGLAAAESGKENLAHVMLLAAAARRWPLVDEIAEWLGGEVPERLVLALMDTVRAERPDWSPAALSAAGAAICTRYNLDGRRLHERVSELASQGDAAAQSLLAAMEGSGGRR